ncbi:MAG TPA: FtsW/RodA/SpoVE family cell cycle protein [Actinomycetota bacterium]|nr:FtsW/RodA/SpoVE family cell cycle protein [Actinomycetota bacterium]
MSRPISERGAAALRHLDLVTVGAVVGLICMGLVAVFTSFSATIDPDRGDSFLAGGQLFNRQLVFVVIAAAIMVASVLTDYRYLKVYAVFMYVVCLVLLIAVLTPLADSIKGSQRWISLGVLKLQPSEIAKPVLAATLGAYISERRGYLDLQDVLRCIGIVLPYAVLVFLQPDFGTMLVLSWILLVMLVIGGAGWRQIVVLISIGTIGVAGLFQLGVVQDYQRTRLEAFLDPKRDPTRTGYNYLLTRQAVGNGGLTGTGINFLKREEPSALSASPGPAAPGAPERLALTTNLQFVPERHTDFVFTVLAEQMGFLGGATLIALYGTIFVRGLRAAGQARDPFGALIATGLVGYMAFQVFVNIGMTVGLVPITGIPLPFVSYGGSSLVASALAVGALLSVQVRRFARPLA